MRKTRRTGTLIMFLAAVMKGTIFMTSRTSCAESATVHHLCSRGSSDYEYELVFCDDEDGDPDNSIDEWYCFKSIVCQDWRNDNRRCPVIKGCATESQCQTESGAFMNGDTQTVGALTVQTWCALAENSEDYSLLSLRTPVNGAARFYPRCWLAGPWLSLVLCFFAAVYSRSRFLW